MKNNNLIKIAVAKYEVSLGNFQKNAKKTNELIQKAYDDNAEIVVFSELSLVSNSLESLYLNEDVYLENVEALVKVIEFSKDKEILIILGNLLKYENRLYNVISVIKNGEILGMMPKKKVNPKYFNPANDNVQVNFLDQSFNLSENLMIDFTDYNLKIGLNISDDYDVYDYRELAYSTHGANLVINLGSNLKIKSKYLKERIISMSEQYGLAYIYNASNLGESTADNLYLNRTIAFFEDLLLDNDLEYNTVIFDTDILRAKAFNYVDYAYYSALEVIDYSSDRKINFAVELNQMPYNKDVLEIFENQVEGLATRLKKINCKDVVIGVSGGLDSTLSLLVIKETFKKLKLDFSGVHCYSMPGFGTSKRTKENAKTLITSLGFEYHELDIKEITKKHFEMIEHDINDTSVVFENAQARMRTLTLFDLANKFNGIMVGTGDLSEIAIGFSTFNGDHISNYNPNNSVLKTQIKLIINEYLKENEELSMVLRSIVDTTISPELLPIDENLVQDTEKTTGKYLYLDFIIYYYLKYNLRREKILFLLKSAFKEEKAEVLEKTLDDFFKRFNKSQFKRNASSCGLNASGLSLSSRSAFNMPSDYDS